MPASLVAIFLLTHFIIVGEEISFTQGNDWHIFYDDSKMAYYRIHALLQINGFLIYVDIDTPIVMNSNSNSSRNKFRQNINKFAIFKNIQNHIDHYLRSRINRRDLQNQIFQ